MMPTRVVTSSLAWYGKLGLCSRRKTFTTVGSVVLFTTIFSYLAFYKDGWKMRIVSGTSSYHSVQNLETNPSTKLSRQFENKRHKKNESFLKYPLPFIENEDYANYIEDESSLINSNSNSVDLTQNGQFDPNSIKVNLAKDTINSSDVKYPDDYVIPLDDVDYNTITETSPGSVTLEVNDHVPLNDTQSDSANISNKVTTSSPAPVGSHSTDLEEQTKSNSSLYVNKDYIEELEYENESESYWENHGQEINNTINVKELAFDPDEVNLLTNEPFQFLDTYKNPCWEEQIHSWYMDNRYLEVENVRRVLTMMSAILRQRQEKGDYHRVRCLPYFFIIGQPKSGSTDLYEKIMAHPEILRPPTKEPHWWSRARLGRHRVVGKAIPIQDYVDLFDFAAYSIEQKPIRSEETGQIFHRRITGEGSMSTFWDNDDWWAMVGNENTTEPRVLNQHYIHHFLPNAKLILILRNPTTRMYSDYLYFKTEKKQPEDFHNDVVNAIQVYNNCTRDGSIRNCVYNRTVNAMAKVRLRVGMYSVFLEDWLKVFPMEQFCIVRLEDYADDPQDVIKRVYNFLEVAQISDSHLERIATRKKANTRRAEDQTVGDMLPATRTLLNDFYRPTNERLAEILQNDLFLWD